MSTLPRCLSVRRDRLRIVADIRILYQIFAFIGVVESFSYEKVFYGQPGDGNLGFDPLGMGKNPASLAYYKVRVFVFFRTFYARSSSCTCRRQNPDGSNRQQMD